MSKNFMKFLEACCNGGDDTCPECGIPNYGQDHNYADSAEQGEDPATNKTNQPALRAAKMSNGTPHPWVVNNGINGNGVGFSFNKTDKQKTLYGEREDDAYKAEVHEGVDVASVLSKLSRK